jgi:hypothetical protein
MKNCIVLSGEYRTFDKTWQQIKTFIDINQLDVYCFLKSVDETEINNVKERLNPKAFVHGSLDGCEPQWIKTEENIRSKLPKGNPMDRIYNSILPMHHGRKLAFDLIDEEYDNLVFCRYDIQFNTMVKFEEVNVVVAPEEQSYNIISDIFAIMPFKYAKHYFLYDNIEPLLATLFEPEFEQYLKTRINYADWEVQIHKYERYCPHIMLLRSLYNNNVEFVTTTQLDVMIQR